MPATLVRPWLWRRERAWSTDCCFLLDITTEAPSVVFVWEGKRVRKQKTRTVSVCLAPFVVLVLGSFAYH